MCCIYPAGTTGGSLHGQAPAEYTTHPNFALIDNTNVAWSLNAESPGFGEDSGGFICIPGSHKAALDIPRPNTTSIDLSQVHKPPMDPGDVLMFGQVAHGTTAWRSPWFRRNVIQFMCSRNVRVIPANPVVGWRWSADRDNPNNALPTPS